MPLQRTFTIPMVLAAGFSLAHAQAPAVKVAKTDEEMLLELLNTPITVASSKASTILTAPSTVTVIDRDMIERYNFTTIEEALDMVPGFSVVSTPSKRRSVPTSRGVLQDNYASKVLLLIDGVPTWHGSLGEGATGRVDIADVERIEVLRGPASVLYGSNAYVGTVNLVLRRAAGAVTGEVQGGAATESGYVAGGRAFIQSGQLGITLSANRRVQKGVPFDFSDAEGVRKSYQDYDDFTNATATLRWKGHTLLLNAHKTLKGFMGPDTSFSSGAGNDETTEGRLLHYGYARTLAKGLDMKFGLTSDWNERSFSRKPDDSVRSEVEGRRDSAYLRLDWEVSPTFDLEAGADVDRRESPRYQTLTTATGAVTSENNMKDRSAREQSYYLQGKWALGSWNLLGGSRYVDNELAGTNLSSRLTAVYAIDERNSLKFIAGQSFRAPTLFEQFFSRYGNPNVKPEKATSVEVAYLRAAQGVYFQALVYQGSYSDKIVRARTNPLSATDTTIKYVNSTEFKATGLELEVKYLNPSFVDAYLGLDTLLKTDSGDQILLPAPTDHYNFKYVPKTHLKAGLSKTLGGLTLSMTALQMSSARGSQPGSAEIGGQTTYSLNASYIHPVGRVLLRHALSVKNAGDRMTLFANYANMDQPRLQAVPMDDLGRQVTYSVRFSF